ncbi:MAG: NusG domain II-containing protein [Oscillospiraceae bacterium]
MRSSIKRKFGRWDALAAAFVLLLAGLSFLLFYGGRGGGELTATVTVEGETVGVYPLSALEEELLLTPEGLPYPLSIRLTREGAEVVWTDCPNKDCLHTGRITRSGESIVCLPNRLTVRLSGGSGAALDAALG